MAFSRDRVVLLAVAAGAALALGVAFAAEWWGGLVPCPLCLLERWPYRVAIGVGVLGCVLPGRLPRVALVAALLIGLSEVGLAGLHVGVEFGWWPSPLPECAAPRFQSGSIAERLRAMPARPSKSCEDGVYPLETVPVSFAALNLGYAVAFSAAIATSVAHRRGKQT